MIDEFHNSKRQIFTTAIVLSHLSFICHTLAPHLLVGTVQFRMANGLATAAAGLVSDL